MVEDFDGMAHSWDEDPARWGRARRAADAVRAALGSADRPVTVELGAGTGMLSRCLADELGPVTLVDGSHGMVNMARSALEREGRVGWDAVVADLEVELPGGPFDLALSLLALHHVKDVQALFTRLRAALNPGGRVALLDLDHDVDGAFHAHVATFDGHHGFHRDQVATWLRAAGFSDVVVTDGTYTERPMDGQLRRFPLFLATARA